MSGKRLNVLLATLSVSLGVAAVHAQAPARSFDAASIRLSNIGTPPGANLQNGRYTASLTLFGHIETAWNLMPSRDEMDAMLAHLPKWVNTDSYEVRAVAEGNPAEDQMRLMVRALLAERFHLKTHTVTYQRPVAALILDKTGKTGPKLRPHSEGAPCDTDLTHNDPAAEVGMFPPVCQKLIATFAPLGVMQIAARNINMATLTTFVSSLGLGRPVVDRTGLNGQFDFVLQYRPGPKADRFDVLPDDPAPPPTLDEALREQLGLKMRPTTAPIGTLVIDHAQRPSEN